MVDFIVGPGTFTTAGCDLTPACSQPFALLSFANGDYFVSRATDGGPMEKIGEVNGTSYDDHGVQCGHAYAYNLTYTWTDGSGQSEASNASSSIDYTHCYPPFLPPSYVQTKVTPEGHVVLRWRPIGFCSTRACTEYSNRATAPQPTLGWPATVVYYYSGNGIGTEENGHWIQVARYPPTGCRDFFTCDAPKVAPYDSQGYIDVWDNNTTWGNTYHYTVMPGNVMAGNTVTVVANLSPTFLLSASLNRSATAITVDLSWSDAQGVQRPASYKIWRQEAASTPIVVGNETEPRIWTDTSVQAGRTYSYAVVIGDRNGNGFISFPCQVTIGDGPQPGPCVVSHEQSQNRPRANRSPDLSVSFVVAGLLAAVRIAAWRSSRR